MPSEKNICDCKERVALELAILISQEEHSVQPDQAREYWLKLYHQARSVVYGTLPELEKVKN